MTVKAWCEAQGITIKTSYYWEKRVVTKASQLLAISSASQLGALINNKPEAMSGGDLVKVLNRYA